MISIARTLGEPETVPAGNPAWRTSTAREPLREPALHLGDEVHDVRVALDGLELRDPDRADRRDPPDVVPPEVDEHHVLGVLLRVGAQLRLERLVLGGVRAAPARPGDGAERHLAALQLDERLRARSRRGRGRRPAGRTGRARGSRAAARGRCRTAGPRPPRRTAARARSAGSRRPSRTPSRARPRRGSRASRRAARATAGRAARRGAAVDERPREIPQPRADPAQRALVERAGVVASLAADLADDVERVAEVVERHHLVEVHEEDVGEPELVRLRDGDARLEELHRVVGDVADEAAREGRAARHADGAVRGERGADLPRSDRRGRRASSAGRCAGRRRGRRSGRSARRPRPTRAGTPGASRARASGRPRRASRCPRPPRRAPGPRGRACRGRGTSRGRGAAARQRRQRNTVMRAPCARGPRPRRRPSRRSCSGGRRARPSARSCAPRPPRAPRTSRGSPGRPAC